MFPGVWGLDENSWHVYPGGGRTYTIAEWATKRSKSTWAILEQCRAYVRRQARGKSVATQLRQLIGHKI